MRCAMPCLILLIAAGPLGAQEYDATIRVREVEVRSGPTAKYYATGKLRQMDKVRVKGVHGDYLAIAPPADAFSLVAKSSVRLLPGREGVIEVEAADTYQGSTLPFDSSLVKGTRLVQGAQVTVLEEVSLPTASGPAPFYKIVPLSESRYIPADAVREPAVVQAGGGGAPARPADVKQASAGGTPSDQIGKWLNMADIAYKKGDANGDWTEAKRLYEELSKCGNHEAQMIAWNRLSYIRKKKPELFAGQPVAPPATTGSSGFRPNTPPTEPLPPLSNAPRNPPANAAPGTTRVAAPGWLRKALTPQKGQPMYYVADGQGRVLYHVTPSTSANLEPYVDQKVEVTGGPMVYRQDLRGNYMIAVSARRVQ